MRPAGPTTVERWIGEYQLVRRVAVGGMAEVFEARRGGSGPSLVLKVLLPQYAQDPEFVQMLADEARLTVGLDHPHLVRVHALAEDGGERFLVMEHVDGPTLAQVLSWARRTGAAPPLALVLAVGRALLEALRYLHQLGDGEGRPLEVVHRDVTPGNVLVSRVGQVKLGDFGIARHRLRSARTRTGVIKGTVQYMAPEQVTGSGIDARADLYGVGLILFELLTLESYIHAESEVDLLRLAENPPARLPSSVRPEVPPALDRLVGRALKRFPEERFRDATSFLLALDECERPLVPKTDEPVERTLADWVSELERSAPSPGGAPATVAGPPARVTRPVAAGEKRSRSGRLLGIVVALGAALALGWLGLTRWYGVRPGAEVTRDAGTRARGVDGALRPHHVAGLDSPRTRDARAPDAAGRAAVIAKRPTRKSGPRAATHDARAPVAARRPDAGSGTVGPSATLEQRYRAAQAALARKGLLVEDLSPTLQAVLRAARAQIDGGQLEGARRSLEELEAALPSLRVDRALVEAKLKRVHQVLQRTSGPAVQGLKERASQALQEFMDGRFSPANRQLNAILAEAARTGR